MRSEQQLIDDALAIWRAGVAAVDAQRLVQDHVHVDAGQLIVGDSHWSLDAIQRIAVVGAGKAGAAMAAGLEAALGPGLMAEKNLEGLVNVPEDCVRSLQRIHLHPARPAGVNEPTEAGAEGAQRILQLVDSLTPRDLCIALISGGGSALLPAPVPGISLRDKQALTRALSAAGANIQELNIVRKQLSQIKGGRLALRCRAAGLISLIISDVLGDPLDTIASGPTVVDTSSPQQALEVLQRFRLDTAELASRAVEYLKSAAVRQQQSPAEPQCTISNLIIGNNALAVDAAGVEAERRGYSHAMIAARELEPSAEEIGTRLAELASQMRHEQGPNCLISGGEPTVQLVPADQRGLGGRNQHLVLAALCHLIAQQPHDNPLSGIAMLSGGTDGEDGPTDAAGAYLSAASWDALRQQQLRPLDYLRRNDSYHFFESLGTLLKTGPTHTNVCDLRVIVVERES